MTRTTLVRVASSLHIIPTTQRVYCIVLRQPSSRAYFGSGATPVDTGIVAVAVDKTGAGLSESGESGGAGMSESGESGGAGLSGSGDKSGAGDKSGDDTSGVADTFGAVAVVVVDKMGSGDESASGDESRADTKTGADTFGADTFGNDS